MIIEVATAPANTWALWSGAVMLGSLVILLICWAIFKLFVEDSDGFRGEGVFLGLAIVSYLGVFLGLISLLIGVIVSNVQTHEIKTKAIEDAGYSDVHWTGADGEFIARDADGEFVNAVIVYMEDDWYLFESEEIKNG